MIISSSFILILVSKLSFAILIGNSATSTSTTTTSPLQTNESEESSGKLLQVGDANQPSDGNTTFYYEANAFLLNNKQKLQQKRKANGELSAPASVQMTSGRNGRMLDLDALVGDLAASRANKDQNMAVGNRQSRFLNLQPQQQPTLEVSGGKRLQIQGFIPIVGVKDVTDESPSSNPSETNDSGSSQHDSINHNQLQRLNNDLPYAQSSTGHASFGVQRYLNSDQQVAASQQVDAKFSGASVVDTLKKPIKKLQGFMHQGGEQNSAQQQQQQVVAPQNCLCVPFYMCKNGYISESSLGKSQIQQMIAQQQQLHQQQQQNHLISSPQIEMKSGQLMPAPQKQAFAQGEQQKELQYADSYVPVDERSFDKELMAMASLTSSESNQNQSSAQQSPSQTDDTNSATISGNATNDGSFSDEYTQDILGRMLGLKSNNSPANKNQPSAGGVCGLLRSCCNIPLHLYPSQQDMANEQLMAQYGSASNNANSFVPKYQQQAINQIAAEQRFYQQQTQHQQKLPYGFPAQMAQQQQSMLMNPLNTPNSLIHRTSNYYAAPTQTSRYPMVQQQQQQVSQFTRAASTPMQQMHQFYPNSQQAKVLSNSMSSNLVSQQQPVASVASYQQSSVPARNIPVGLSSRKILDGRCGLRHASGIAGRVQSLQYHESSADFGEYPAQAAILKRLSGSDNLFVCGGTLISQYWIATAAHCIKKHAQNELKIRLGEWDVHRDDEFYPFVEKEVRDLVVHPEFVAGNLVNDIALLRLDSPVDPSLPHVNPACLPALDETFNRQRCWVTGWGKDSFGQKGTFQSVLREVELPVVGQSECQAALRSTRLGPHYRLHSGFICAGGEGGKDACEGDGGSGLYCIQDGVIKVAGLVSWGIGCGMAGVPGVYVNLAHYRTWIENIISIDEDIYSPYPNMLIGSNGPISERSKSNVTDAESNPATISTTSLPPTTLSADATNSN